MFKQIAGAAALCGLSAAAIAQSSVTVYGSIDTAVEYLTHVGATRANVSRMGALTGAGASRLGFRGREDLGHGLKADFVLEMGFSPDSGTLGQGGRGFGRQAFVGLSGPWGSASLGRQYNMIFWSNLDADIMGPNLHGNSSLDSYFPNARADNALAYKGTFAGLTLGATYSFGRDSVNAGPSIAGANCAGENAADSQACRAWSLMAKYDTPTWGAALAHDNQAGGTGAFAGLVRADQHDRRSLANAYLKLDHLKLGAGYMQRKNDGSASMPQSGLWWLGASYPVGAWRFDAQYSQLKFKNADNKAQLLAVKSTYALSKRTAVYASLGHVKNSGLSAVSVSSAQGGGAPLAGVNQTGLALGLSHAF
ncbi:porin [Pantoea sp. 18069]|uniref:porin n=1 Tax=Pantoea sp. 18069 TaxID=2681415 RepID=UPI001356CF36|nr:porin [Pantoea sp. 18069]